jgi:hypothetical protein
MKEICIVLLLKVLEIWISFSRFKYSVFLDDSVYFHCPSKTNLPIQWNFLSFNYYLMKTLPILYEKDTKIDSVKIIDAGMYVCQTENTIHQRIILTIIRK